MRPGKISAIQVLPEKYCTLTVQYKRKATSTNRLCYTRKTLTPTQQRHSKANDRKDERLHTKDCTRKIAHWRLHMSNKKKKKKKKKKKIWGMDGEQQRHGNNTRLDQTEDWNQYRTKEELIKSLQKDLAQRRVSLSERVFNQETISAHKHLKQQKQGEERHRPSNRLSKGTQTSWTTLELLINMTTWRSGRKRQGREQGQMRHRRCAISSRNAGRARDSINSKPPASLLRWELEESAEWREGRSRAPRSSNNDDTSWQRTSTEEALEGANFYRKERK